jgi:hypothetical protein
MAEIKSTLDLVMERTRDMRPSRKEREEMLAREREKRAKGLLLRLNEGHLKPESLRQAAVEAAGPDEARALEAELLRLLVQDLSLDQDLGPAVGGLEALAGETASEPLQALQVLWQEYRDGLAVLEGQAAAEVLQDLARRGITGSALRPKAARTPALEARQSDLRRRMETGFEQARRALQEVVGPAQS